MDPTRLAALSENLTVLFGQATERGDRQTLRLVGTTDHTRDLIYALVSPHGLTGAEWDDLLENSFQLYAAIEQGRVDHDLSEFSEAEMAAYDSGNLEGLIVLGAARRGWTVIPVHGSAWARSDLEI